MALRWCTAEMVEAGKQFRRVNGHTHLAEPRAALEGETTKRATTANVRPVAHGRRSKQSDDQRGRHRSSTALGTTSNCRTRGHTCAGRPSMVTPRHNWMGASDDIVAGVPACDLGLRHAPPLPDHSTKANGIG